jgi:hypothetical protein
MVTWIKMITKTKFIVIGIISLLAGSALTTPLLLAELDIVPFWTMPEGQKANLSVSVVYANFTIQNDLPRYNINTGEYCESNLDYFIVLNITNLSGVPTTLSNLAFASVKNATIIPSALGGFHATHQDGAMIGGGGFMSYGPVEGYVGNVMAGRVEGLWLDGEWVNTTLVPEGGLSEIWKSQNIFPTKELEGIWKPNWIPYEEIKNWISENADDNFPPYVSFGGARSNDTGHYYTYGGTIFTYEGGNYWIEGVPLIEYVADNEVKATAIYYDGSWIDATGKVEFVEEPFVAASDFLFGIKSSFHGYIEKSSAVPSGYLGYSSSVGGRVEGSAPITSVFEFDNVWEPYQSRLIVLNGSVDVGNLWKPDELLKDNELTLYTALNSYVADNTVDGVKVNTASITAKLMTIQLERTEGSYLFNSILSDDQRFTFDASGLEVFIDEEEAS